MDVENHSQNKIPLFGFIPCAGFGTRMGGLTQDFPKPLLSIHEVPMLVFSLYWMDLWKVEQIYINVHFQAEKMIAFLKNKKKTNVFISHEKEQILGTGGGIRFALQERVPENACLAVMNPDTLFFFPDDYMPTESLLNDQLIHLYLSSGNNGNYTALSLCENGCVEFGTGNEYFTGFSLMRYSCLQNHAPGKSFELGMIFQETAKKKLLGGSLLPGYSIDVGNKENFELISKKIFTQETHLIRVREYYKREFNI